jgi:alpha/beta superfamily hydrolase
MSRPRQATISTVDGVELEARWDGPPEPATTVVFCHPHPLQGGTMNAPLMHRVARRLVEHDIRVLRFNFRGVGRSTGEWGGGEGEVLDVAAAMELAREDEPAASLSGWSFGAGVALQWQARTGDTSSYAGIAPGLAFSPPPNQLIRAPRLFILGDRDQLVDVAAVTAYGRQIGARLEIMQGSDHFFNYRQERVADLIAGWLSGQHDESMNGEPHQTPDQSAVDPDELEIAPE